MSTICQVTAIGDDERLSLLRRVLRHGGLFEAAGEPADLRVASLRGRGGRDPAWGLPATAGCGTARCRSVGAAAGDVAGQVAGERVGAEVRTAGGWPPAATTAPRGSGTPAAASSCWSWPSGARSTTWRSAPTAAGAPPPACTAMRGAGLGHLGGCLAGRRAAGRRGRESLVAVVLGEPARQPIGDLPALTALAAVGDAEPPPRARSWAGARRAGAADLGGGGLDPRRRTAGHRLKELTIGSGTGTPAPC